MRILRHNFFFFKVRFILDGFFWLADGIPKGQAWKMGDQLSSYYKSSSKRDKESLKEMVSKNKILEIFRKWKWEDLIECMKGEANAWISCLGGWVDGNFWSTDLEGREKTRERGISAEKMISEVLGALGESQWQILKLLAYVQLKKKGRNRKIDAVLIKRVQS